MRIIVTALVVTLAGCSHPFTPETPHPTPEQMQELLRAPVTLPGKFSKPAFTVQVNPRFAPARSAVWVTCYVPASYGAGRIRFGIEDVQVSEGPLDHLQYRLLVENVPCGTLKAVCTIITARGQQHASQTLEVKGGICDTLVRE